MKVRIGTSVAAAALLLAWGVATANAQNGSGATYVGSETCAGCHEEVVDAMAKTVHGSPAFDRLSAHGCESCHGPGSVHAEDPDVVENRPTMSDKSAAQITAVCTECHSGGNQFFWKTSVHSTRNVACTDCHSVHAAKSEKNQLKLAGATDTCVTCHKNIRADMWKNSHHPIREGKISCADCHNPHGTQTAKMLNEISVNEQCFSCHAEKRGPFIWEHAPVRESCLNCHTPHGSNHIKLQKTSVPYLCQQCHMNTRHPGTLYDNQVLPSPDNPATGSNRIFNRACLDCHAAIHGSNHPSSPYLGY
ncbi:MAG: DmsE family decaheme c-type cytochrome [Acidobacteria bacterium]|nr:DmsE family decaheme c-type cytochrome [Acidobacteriota bacterium]MCB9377159.1 DmsE family decaheme c-type cytochrome [Holophagales bacterium]